LANCHASGTKVIEDFGLEHMRSGKPIVYTSVDSVLQIAAHEESFGLERLYDLCRIARRLCDPLNVGRVIARPFIGTAPENFTRTPRRKDFSMPPPPGNILDRALSAGRDVVSIGKIGDLFAHHFTGREIKRVSDSTHFDAVIETLPALAEGGLLFANFVDLDTEFGHRRDPAGYAHGLEELDRRLPELEALLRPGDLCFLTADHGNDPTFRGTDHTREHVPVLAWGPGTAARAIGRRPTFADIGASVAAHLSLEPTVKGTSFISGSRA
jgi:phosphopentomutase